MEKGRAYPFSLLVGVFLNDTLEAGAGQFTVFPGSHLYLAKVVAERGEGVLYGEQSPAFHLPPLPPHCSKPVELMVKAGDAVLVHPLLAHRVGLNYSPHVRHACFFRVSALGHEKARGGLVTGDPFGEVRTAAAAV
jgi:ectoine hydroxylase-related dioxygenase (phytanoyl-CoA dioxygenase family)